jgi:hypothetical protein
VEIANLIARRYIQRRDVKAIQHSDGSYAPVRNPWTRSDLENHLAGKQTFGHYLLDQNDKCKLFTFDIDLEKMGFLPDRPMPENGTDEDIKNWCKAFVPCNPREAWRDRSHPGRPWMKYQMRMLIGMLMRSIQENLELPCVATYSGNKGVHVTAFTGIVSAEDARDGAMIALDGVGDFVLSKGRNFYKHKNEHAYEGYPNFSIEVYPKQTTLADKDLGNLIRLPLGKNLKSSDPTFFIDVNAPMAVLRPIDPVWALTTPSPWQVAGA